MTSEFIQAHEICCIVNSDERISNIYNNNNN
jgi:hypothetical protein